MLSPLNTLFAMNLFVPLGMERKTLFAMILAASTDFLINLMLIPLFAHNGAAVGTVIAELIETIFIMISLKGFVNRKKIIKQGAKYFTYSSMFVIFNVLAKIMLKDMYVQMIVVFAVSIIAYFVVLILTKDDIVWDVMRILNKKVNIIKHI